MNYGLRVHPVRENPGDRRYAPIPIMPRTPRECAAMETARANLLDLGETAEPLDRRQVLFVITASGVCNEVDAAVLGQLWERESGGAP